MIPVLADHTYEVTITFNDLYTVEGGEISEEGDEEVTAKLITNIYYTGATNINSSYKIYVQFLDYPAYFDSVVVSGSRIWTPEEILETFVLLPSFPPGHLFPLKTGRMHLKQSQPRLR